MMTFPNLTVRPLRDDDIPAVLELLETTFDGWPRVPTPATPIDHLRWKLGDGREGESLHFVAELEGRIAAFLLNHLWRVKVRDKELIALRGMDSAVRPEYQARGLMSTMKPAVNQYLDKVSDLFLGGSDNPAVLRIHEREGRLEVGHRWVVFVRPLTLRGALRTFKLRWDRSPGKLAASVMTFARLLAIEARARVPVRPERSLSISTVGRFDERIDGFCEEASQPFDFIMVRNAALLNWRYADARAGEFTIRLALERERVVGYSVLRVANGAGHIADLLALPGRLDAVSSLARDACAELRGSGVDVIECWLFQHHPYAAVLRSCGFLGHRRRGHLTYKPVAVPASEIEFLGDRSMAAHLSVGDMDWV